MKNYSLTSTHLTLKGKTKKKKKKEIYSTLFSFDGPIAVDLCTSKLTNNLTKIKLKN